jgi:hypothetical protein
MIPTRSVSGGAAASMAVIVFGLVGLAMRTEDSAMAADPRPSSPGPVSIRLLGPASGIRGANVPAHILAGQRPRFFQIDEPRSVEVTLPGGKIASLPVKSVTVVSQFNVETKSAVVVDVELLPLPKAVSYREAVAAVRRGLGQMGITPDEKMQRKMALWPEDGGDVSEGFHPLSYRAGMNLSDSHGILVDMRPAPGRGWFIVYTFAAGIDARRVLWDPTFKPAAKPTAEEKEGANRGSGSK